jgi:hypothetical protein
MLKKLLLLLLFVSGYSSVMARQGGSHLQISLLTCGPGDEAVWEVFGHTAVRIVDSEAHTDLVYNYGTFDFGPDFELQFMRGKLLYRLAIQDYRSFLVEYIDAKRKVEEQVLHIDDKQKEQIFSFLEWNAEPENSKYKYDFFFDNCATRIRDIFPRPEVFGKAFQFSNTLPPSSRLTFRDIINQYFYRDHWTRLGVNILLGSRIDRVMTNSDIMFLPDYLRDGIGGATVNGKKIAGPTTVLLPGNQTTDAGVNGPFLLLLAVAVLTIAGLSLKKLKLLGTIMSTLLLFVTGILGCLILVMWFATDHQGCANNFNLLWCLPLNIVIAFFRPKGRGLYALIAIFLLLASLVLHIVKVQGLTLLELSPLFVALLFVYGSIYKKGQLKPQVYHA